MITFILLVLTIVFAIELNKSQKEVKKLQKELSEFKYQNQNVKEGEEKNSSIIKTQEVTNIQENIQTTSLNNEINTIKQEPRQTVKKKNDQQIKNTLILITGAILIVLAAIVFLMSTWSTIPNTIKTGTLILLMGVFVGASYLAENKLKLDLTAKTFYYIAMAYIPIVMFSISVFELFGYYLSISGDGNYIYFAICTIMLSALYFAEAIKRSRKALIICSYITQVLAVIFTLLIFNLNFYSIVLGILIYLFAMNLIIEKCHLFSEYAHFIKNTLLVIQIIMSVVTIFATLWHWIMASCGIVDMLNILLLTVTYCLILRKNGSIKIVCDIGFLFLVLTIINLKFYVIAGDIKSFIMAISAELLYLFNYVTTRKLVHKIIAYTLLNVLLLSVSIVFKIDELIKYIPFITTLIVLLVEMIDRNELVKNYLIPSFAVTFLALNVEINTLSFICLLITIVVYIFFLKREKLNNWFMAFSLVALIPSLYMPEIKLLKPYHMSIVISFILITMTTCKSLLERKINGIYLFASILYIVLSITSFEMNTYVSLWLILLWAVAHAVTYEKPDIFKVATYITGLALYNYFLYDINYEGLAIISYGGYLCCLYLITRTILKKHWKEYKIVEYIFTSIIFIYVLDEYTGMIDAMIFILALVCFVIFGYIKKVGPLFLTSLIAIVINIFQVTQEFWESIPWWVYMLVIGSTLIIFATRNEIKEKNGKFEFKNIIKKLKENVDI